MFELLSLTFFGGGGDSCVHIFIILLLYVTFMSRALNLNNTTQAHSIRDHNVNLKTKHSSFLQFESSGFVQNGTPTYRIHCTTCSCFHVIHYLLQHESKFYPRSVFSWFTTSRGWGGSRVGVVFSALVRASRDADTHTDICAHLA